MVDEKAGPLIDYEEAFSEVAQHLFHAAVERAGGRMPPKDDKRHIYFLFLGAVAQKPSVMESHVHALLNLLLEIRESAGLDDESDALFRKALRSWELEQCGMACAN